MIEFGSISSKWYYNIKENDQLIDMLNFFYLNNIITSQIKLYHIFLYFRGAAFVYGPVLLTPMDLPNCSGRQFFKQEVLLTNNEETVPISKITGKCSVLEHAEYISCKYFFLVLYIIIIFLLIIKFLI